MTEELQTTLLEEAKKLKFSIEKDYFALCEVLYRIESEKAYEGQFLGFGEYCSEELGLTSKSSVSKMVSVGRFVNENNFKKEELAGASYTTVYESLQLHKGEDAHLVLAEAKTNTLADIRKNRREKEPCNPHEYKTLCIHCWGESAL